MISEVNHVLYFGLLLSLVPFTRTCLLKKFEQDGHVCVCNASFCDFVGPLQKPKDHQTFLVYTSNLDGLRLTKTTGQFGSFNNTQTKTIMWNLKGNEISIDHDKTYQKINGFGGAFTDAAGINIKSLGVEVKNQILRSYFSKDGIEYSLGRIPIGGTDFSTHPYSYDDGPIDVKLKNFALQKEDKQYKIPLIKDALKLSKDLRLFATPWVAPVWMKSNNASVGGAIKPEMYQPWADYQLRFIEEYDKQGIEIWAITTGNEPTTTLIPFAYVPSSYWSGSTMSKWVSENLGPTIRKSKYSAVKILAFDDSRFILVPFAIDLFKSNETRKYVDGLAVHWYLDKLVPASVLSLTHHLFPNKFILGTEACEGDSFLGNGPRLGDWSGAMSYAKYIILDLQNWVTGWTDWNMALNKRGGPTYISNFVDSPIIIDQENNVFYKQPTFYAMGHFSKFIPKDSVRVNSGMHPSLDVVAFKRPDGGTSVVILNDNETRKYVDGLAVHWYLDKLVPASVLSLTHHLFPNKFIPGTEACEGGSFLGNGPRLGDWSRAMSYAKYIILDLQNWVTGWTDWNMALNKRGGPTYTSNFVDSPIIVDQENNVFYKQPTFYAMGHFSKFIPKDSVRVNAGKHPSLDIVAFKRPDGGTSVVILNQKSKSIPIVIKQEGLGDISLNISPKSITTVVHW